MLKALLEILLHLVGRGNLNEGQGAIKVPKCGGVV
jgi:hypothetical protein